MLKSAPVQVLRSGLHARRADRKENDAEQHQAGTEETNMISPFSSIRIGPLELANRLVMAPVKTAFGNKDGRVSDRLVSYFRRRAEGGVGLVVSEPLYVDKRGREHPRQIGADADDKLDGLRRLSDAVHQGGAKVFAHLNHGGRAANPKASGSMPEAPSSVVCPSTGCVPEELTEGRIEEIVRAFAEAAIRAAAAGFDGVELQFGLGYLVSQFLSPATNLRTDEYGGDIERRTRFAREVFAAVRAAVGEKLSIGVRISGSEKAASGLEIEDAKELARHLAAWGADLIHVATGSACESPPWYFQHMALPPEVNEGLAAQVKAVVSLPVIAAGRLGDPSRLREVLALGMVDMVALGRPLLADPDLPAKMSKGQDERVLLCGHCLQGCLAGVKSGEGVRCNVNPWLGYEAEEREVSVQPGRVVVVGGGPAGMQAALTAQRRGHRVTLFERDGLGGQYTLASIPPGKKRIEQSLRSLVAQVEGAPVEVRLGREATVGDIKALRPEAVIVATGSRPFVPTVPGLEEPATAEEILSGAREPGRRVLVLGGGMVGIEVAELLASQDRHCVVVEALDEVARDMSPLNRKLLMKRLASLPVELHTGTELVRMEGRRAIVTREGQERDLGAFDSVVVAVGNRSDDRLSAKLRAEGLAVAVVGDAEKPARVVDAVSSGRAAAAAI
jgi:2,4-dienoyl-CoA reductase (NADPH2)